SGRLANRFPRDSARYTVSKSAFSGVATRVPLLAWNPPKRSGVTCWTMNVCLRLVPDPWVIVEFDDLWIEESDDE
ncbi:MAG: hypothetical protein ACT4P5_21295, partial [Armatimonadota bacterium]